MFFSKHLCVSVIGKAHIKSGLPNQDAAITMKKRKYALAVVSDGLASKKYADVGSKAACNAIKKVTKQLIKNKSLPIPDVLNLVVTTWEKEISPLDKKDCSATCLLVIANKEKIFAAQLGDGLIALLGKDKSNTIVLKDTKNDSFANITCSLASSNHSQHWETVIAERKKYKAIFLCSDGISNDLIEGSEIRFIQDLLDYLKHKTTFVCKMQLKNMVQN